ncbi:MAG: DCC1-like thiol-disulfide oxidoreductase family protein, partial [Moraxellaceae bacterium]
LAVAGFSREDAMTYMCIKDRYGNWYTHMDAIRLLYKVGGVTGSSLLFLPVIKQFGDFMYPYVARNRYKIPNWVTRTIYGKTLTPACKNGVCKITPDKR